MTRKITAIGFVVSFPHSLAFFQSATLLSSLRSQRDSSVALFANRKRKGKKWAKRNGGGGGFGDNNEERNRETVPANSESSADVVARLNALLSVEAEVEEPNRPKESSPSFEIDEIDKPESTMLTARYKKEFEYQQDLLASKTKNTQQLVQVSESPLIFTIDEFIDPEACRHVRNDASGCFDLMYPEKVCDNLFNGQESEMDGLLFNLASSLDHADTKEAYPDGLHVDTNNQCLNRHVTCILYLNDIPEKCGGATVFPLARTLPSDDVLDASRRLLDEKISHTRQKMNHRQHESDARLLESRLPNTDYPDNPQISTTIRIQPKAGRLLIFFSRDSNGQEDPRTWHAGERILPNEKNQVTEKRILTLFKEVHYDGDESKERNTRASLEAYLAPMVEEQRSWLTAKARLQRAILGGDIDSTPRI
jgi:hypothetical protein